MRLGLITSAAIDSERTRLLTRQEGGYPSVFFLDPSQVTRRTRQVVCNPDGAMTVHPPVNPDTWLTIKPGFDPSDFSRRYGYQLAASQVGADLDSLFVKYNLEAVTTMEDGVRKKWGHLIPMMKAALETCDRVRKETATQWTARPARLRTVLARPGRGSAL